MANGRIQFRDSLFYCFHILSSMLMRRYFLTILTKSSVVFLHDLRGHPRHTSTNSPAVANGDNGRRGSFKRLITFKSVSTPGTSQESNDGGAQSDPFWPKDILAADFYKGRVWTYGYNANIVKGIFHAHNQNSIPQHGRDLAARLERVVDNDVISCSVQVEFHELVSMCPSEPSHLYRPQSWRYCRQNSP